MNDNLNLVEILKDCPSSTKLYSTVFGEVEFDHIENNSKYPIIIKTERCGIDRFSIDGKRFVDCGECVLFPSKGQRDWSKFNPKKKDFVPPCKFKDGDIVATKDGSQVFILKRDDSNGKGYCYTGYNFNYDEPFHAGVWCFSRFATEGEKRKFFDAIKLKGYKWNAETKTLEKLVKPKFKVRDKIIFVPMKYMVDFRAKGTISEITNDKYIFTDGSYMFISNQNNWKLDQDKFDPKTFKAFDKILVRDDCESVWQCDIFSHINYGLEMFCYKCMGCSYKYCIPYNDDTKHLVGKTENAPEYYRYWED